MLVTSGCDLHKQYFLLIEKKERATEKKKTAPLTDLAKL